MTEVVRRLRSDGTVSFEGSTVSFEGSLCRLVGHVDPPSVSVICISCVEIQTNTTLQNYWVVAS